MALKGLLFAVIQTISLPWLTSYAVTPVDVVVKDTKQDLYQPSGSYWEQITEDACINLRRKTTYGRWVRPDDTDTVLSVNSQRDFDKHF